MSETFQWLTIREAADRARYSTRTIHRMIGDGKLTAYRGNRQLRIKSSDIDALFVRVDGGNPA